MHAIGVIAEYNPFHHGHRHQLRALRSMNPDADGIIALMSGSFTQRGAPCILDKWTRARHAVVGGADLVLELPFVFACRSAQDFARGGVSLLAALGVADRLAFGTEAADIAPLARAAALIDTEDVQNRLHTYVGAGASYAAALSQALVAEDVSEEMMRAPNNILAVEYLRALCRAAPHIAPVAVPRRAAQHNDTALHAGITSASSIRAALGDIPPPWELLQESVMPAVLADLHAAYDAGLPAEDALLRLLRYALLTANHAELHEINGMTEGIEHRLIRAHDAARTYDDFLTAAAAKRYARSRIARLVVHLLIRFQRAQAARFDARGAAYIRPLAFNPRGQKLLRRIKERASLPIVTRTAAFLPHGRRAADGPERLLRQMLSFDILATELRLLTLPTDGTARPRTDFLTSPCVVT